jgi:hypothetical protein
LREREKDAASLYARIQDPVRQLLDHLDAAKEPLARIQTVFAPVKGLFGARTMGDEYFQTDMQTFRISDGPHSLQICHDFDDFKTYAAVEKGRIKLAMEQVALVVLTGLEEIRQAELPLWDFMMFRLRFAKHRQVARILQEMYPNLQREQGKLMWSEAEELFEMAKYWFNHAGRGGYPMRADFLQAGLKLIAAEEKDQDVVRRQTGFDSLSHKFWVVSTWPMQTVAAIEALCHEFGKLKGAGFGLEDSKSIQRVSLVLDFGAHAQKAIATAGAELERIVEQCAEFEAQRSVTRGNRTFAAMQLFGGVPEKHGPSALARRDELKNIEATLEFGGDGKIHIVWTGPKPSEKGARYGALWH